MEEHKDIFSFRKNSSSAIDYKNLVNEFLEDRESESERNNENV